MHIILLDHLDFVLIQIVCLVDLFPFLLGFADLFRRKLFHQFVRCRTGVMAPFAQYDTCLLMVLARRVYSRRCTVSGLFVVKFVNVGIVVGRRWGRAHPEITLVQRRMRGDVVRQRDKLVAHFHAARLAAWLEQIVHVRLDDQLDDVVGCI